MSEEYLHATVSTSKYGDRTLTHFRCEHTGLACFTVRHKDANGQWVANTERDKTN